MEEASLVWYLLESRPQSVCACRGLSLASLAVDAWGKSARMKTPLQEN
jgi:hypothetical protein